MRTCQVNKEKPRREVAIFFIQIMQSCCFLMELFCNYNNLLYFNIDRTASGDLIYKKTTVTQ